MADKLRISGDMVDVGLKKILDSYSARTIERINAASLQTVQDLVRITKRTAPVKTGLFRKHIHWETGEERPTGNIYVWRVREPRHRMTHLLVHGHRTRNHQRLTKANPFLQNAIDEVQPKFDARIEAAITGDQI